MKALEKDRARRYETATGLAMDIRRFLEHEPVVARPPSAGYRLQKLIGRNKLAFIAVALIILVLTLSSFVSTWRFVREKEARQQAVTAEAKATAQARRSDQISRLLKDTLAGAGPSVALGRDTTMLREILDAAADRVTREVGDQPDVEAELCQTIGRAYYDLKELDKAETIHRRALRLREAPSGATNNLVADSLMDLALVLNSRAERHDLAEACQLLQRALQVRRELLGDLHVLVADTLQVLGWNLAAQGETGEPELLLRQALRIREQLLDPESPAIVANLNGLARLLSADSTCLDEAEAYARRAFNIHRRRVVPNDPSLIDTLSTLAGVLTARDELTEGQALYREAIALHRKLYGDGDELLTGLLDGLAFALMKAGEYAEAEQVIRDAIDLQTRIRGPEHPHLASTLLGVQCDIYRRQGRWPEVEEVARHWIPLMRKTAPEHRETLLHGLHWFGSALAAQGKWPEAEPVLRECLELCASLHECPRPPDSIRCTGIRRLFGEALLRVGKPGEAEPLLLASYEDLKSRDGEWERVDIEKCLVHLVELYETTHRPDQAARWKATLAELRKSEPRSGQGASPP